MSYPAVSPPAPGVIATWLKWYSYACVAAVVVGPLAVLIAIFPHRRHRGYEHTEAVNNARQVGMALFEFQVEYGKFPDATTIDAVRKDSEKQFPLGTKYSNDYFRQLVSIGIAQSEPMFYAKNKNSRKPDGIADPSHALTKGEVGFAYLAGLPTTGNPSRPLIVAPLIPGTDRFDPKPFDGKAILLKMDNSVTALPITNDGHVLMDGKNIFDPSHPMWEGKPPVIFYPEF